MKQVRLRHLLVLVLTLLSAQLGWSQGVTTSALNGIITDKAGEGLPGATVIAVHTPTNTQYVAPTNADGRFNIQAMRVGGPYTVRVTFVGYQEAVREGIFLSLGQNLRLDVNLSESTQTLAGVEISGRRDALINSDRTGSVTSVQREQLERLPTINRSLNDFTRLTPQAGPNNAVGGGNQRQNYFSVDGSDFNNNFGIGGNLPANGSPISLDAIEQLSVSVTPYDVRQSGFIGSSINAVTRSGSNNFSGSVYSFLRNEKFIGDRVGNERLDISDSQFNQYGIRLGGPIIKDKVFFFFNYETEKNTTPGQTRVASTPSRRYGTPGDNQVTRPRATQLDSISNYLRDNFGYETGGYQGYDFVSDRTKILGRIDWNISQNHRFNVRYSQTEGKTPSFASTSSSPISQFPLGFGGRDGINALPFRNTNYFTDANFYSFAAELNSTFGATMGNTLRATYTKQDDSRSTDSKLFPFVDILENDLPLTSFGAELFTVGNVRDVESYSFRDDFTWQLGNHNLTLGAQADFSTTRNGFQRMATSYYRFNSWQDFVNANSPDPAIRRNAAPTDFGITYSLSPGFAQAFPSFDFAQYSAYAQDEINITPRLRLTGGIRVDYTTFPKSLQEHKLITPLVFNNNERINVANLPDPKFLISPRFGANWDVLGNSTLQIRGGTGIFTGRIPNVYIVSQASDAGLLQVTQTAGGPGVDIVQTGINGKPYDGFKADYTYYRPDTPPAAGTVIPSTITYIGKDFKFPQTWKTSLGVDVKLPLGIVGSLEGIYNKDLNTALFRNVNLVTPTALNVPGYPDTRLIYPSSNSNKFVNPLVNGKAVPNGTSGGGAFNTIVLGNGKEGYYWSVTAKLEKQFDAGFYASVAYAHSQAKNLFDGNGDQALSAWQLTPTVNGSNNPELGYAGFVVPDRVIAQLSYRKEYLNHLGTTLSVFYEGSQGGRFSYIYSADVNRDGANSDLIYVPKDPSEITFVTRTIPASGSTPARTVTPEEQSEAFFAYIEQDKYLRTRKGKYAERNGALQPWRNQFDVKLLQDLFVNIGEKRNTLQLSIDVFNIGNLINSDWGLNQSTNVQSILVPQNASAVSGPTTANPNGVRPTYQLQLDRGSLPRETFRNTLGVSSTYYFQLGLRYIFN
ncbi:carboxypeptidase regulatory-like domain-containing protein [Hymenobacter sp. B81]|uniref:TonB-dependent receptor n=1 Tax=Hymenobacter sp. B81 TaxID=3344878 RepID=UPI0037DCAD33